MPMDAPDPDCLLSAVHDFLRQCRRGAETRSCRSYWETHSCITAAEMQLLAALSDEPLCVEACAQRLSRDREQVIQLLDALVSVGLLKRRDGGYIASPATALYCRAFVDGGLSL